MAFGNTVTLTASGRLPGALSAVPSATSLVIIPAGMVGIMPHATSGFSCCALSCAGIDSILGYKTSASRGMIGIPAGAGEISGTIYQASAKATNLRFCSVNLERPTSTTVYVRGGTSAVK